MAIIKGLSLKTIRALKGTITFRAYKGMITASAHMKKIGPNRSPRVTIGMNRFKIANFYLKRLSAEVVNAWKDYVTGTDWTWKDAFISKFMKAWAENNAQPIVITEMSFTWNGANAHLAFHIAEWYYGEDFGFGTDGYGTCPYGTPTDLTVDQPNEITPEYRFGFYPELRRATLTEKEE